MKTTLLCQCGTISHHEHQSPAPGGLTPYYLPGEPILVFCSVCGGANLDVCTVCNQRSRVEPRNFFCGRCGADDDKIRRGVLSVDVAKCHKSVWEFMGIVAVTGYIMCQYVSPWMQARVLAGLSPLPSGLNLLGIAFGLYVFLPAYLMPLCALLFGPEPPPLEVKALMHGPGMIPVGTVGEQDIVGQALLTRKYLRVVRRRAYRKLPLRLRKWLQSTPE